MNAPQKTTFVCADSLHWMRARLIDEPGASVAVITSLPDAHELDLSIDDWRRWFVAAASLCLRVANKLPCIFYQTDRKHDGAWISKGQIIGDAAQALGMRLIWRKIVLRRDVGKVDLFRQSYSEMLAFGCDSITSGEATPDVIAPAHVSWAYGMNIEAVKVAINFVKRYTDTVIDPFCGRGTVAMVAEQIGISSIGIDIDPDRIKELQTRLI
jgi:hypothetical protein